ncbi:carbonyl reductase [Tripterygium wilfordii]|uniref:Carbonyl reductase n=1 Tax=Tripterygium wilfordii TaxID=458696 RepID=A0A7J7BTY9_TRIWF|nr:3-oxoacyl-[acyl-carrier-protein] reductase FabG [Tripterygium wilfordii]XP_038696847.1 3-oxoacyl-[acyl-carrier-protein] reductase FabG [Tripterygium wilfordii]KAF5725440.1 carbonyl reductase [Tripterygium wilfordii]
MEDSGKKVLITTNGDEISHNIALHLAKQGCRLVLMGDKNNSHNVAEKLTGALNGVAPVEVVGIDMEEENQDAFDMAVDKACKMLGNLDAFVHCYSYEAGEMQDPLQVCGDEFKKIVKINFMASWFLLKAVGRRMREGNSGGSIVFLTSIVGAERGLYPGAAAYGSCLAGVQHLVKASAMEIGKYKIRVNAIARGLQLQDPYPVSVGKERAEKLTADVIPRQRWLDAKNDLASTVIYLISDGSRYMTGTTIFVDGGQSITRPRMRSYM